MSSGRVGRSSQSFESPSVSTPSRRSSRTRKPKVY
jgi:hypothetical protein